MVQVSIIEISARKGGADSLRLVDAPLDVVRKMWARLTRDDVINQGKGARRDGEVDVSDMFIEEAQSFCKSHQSGSIEPTPEEMEHPNNLKVVLKRV